MNIQFKSNYFHSLRVSFRFIILVSFLVNFKLIDSVSKLPENLYKTRRLNTTSQENMKHRTRQQENIIYNKWKLIKIFSNNSQFCDNYFLTLLKNKQIILLNSGVENGICEVSFHILSLSDNINCLYIYLNLYENNFFIIISY